MRWQVSPSCARPGVYMQRLVALPVPSLPFIHHHVCQACVPRLVLAYSTHPSLSHAAIREYDAKQLLSYWLPRSPVPIPCKADSSVAPVKVAQVQW